MFWSWIRKKGFYFVLDKLGNKIGRKGRGTKEFGWILVLACLDVHLLLGFWMRMELGSA